VAGEEAKVVGTSLEGNTGSVTFSIPVEQLKEQFGNSTDSLAVGELVSRDLGVRYGLKTQGQSLSIPSTRNEAIQLARDIYTSEPIVANVVDLMVDLMMTGMENQCEDTKAKEYFDIMCKYGDMDKTHRDIFLEYLLAGDIFLMRGPQQKVTYGKDINQPYYKYSILNPLFVQVDGPLVFESEQIGIQPNQELKKLIEDKNNSKIIKTLPKELIKAVKTGALYYPNQDIMSRISRKRLPYERYATPYLARIFEPILIKRRMREADVAVAETVRYVLVTVTTGNDEYPAKQEDLNKLATMFKNPSKSFELIWNHTIGVTFHFPDPSLFDDTKYKQVNTDTIQGLGIPPVLIDGGGGTFATAWTSLVSVMERLESIRDEVKRWQESEYRRIMEQDRLPFKVAPSVEFKPMNLRDEKSWRALLLEMYDRGLISIDTLLSLTDLDILVETRNREVEKKSGVEEVLVPRAKPAGPQTGGRPVTTVQDGKYPQRDQIPPQQTGPAQQTPPKAPSA
jgi:hypothetical protein